MRDDPDFDLAADNVPPACRPTVDRLQLALDGDLPGITLEADPHLAACATCRERTVAARLVIATLATPLEPIPLPSQFTDRVLSGVRTDRSVRLRRRSFALVGGLAVAAAILIATWFGWPGGTPRPNDRPRTPDVATAQPSNAIPELAPAPRSAPEPREGQPVRLGDEFSKAEQALRGSSRPITEPAAVAPQVLVKLTDVLTRPTGPAGFEPARISLIDLPDAARTGLQPVTDVAQKAFTRLMRDVGATQASARPN